MDRYLKLIAPQGHKTTGYKPINFKVMLMGMDAVGQLWNQYWIIHVFNMLLLFDHLCFHLYKHPRWDVVLCLYGCSESGIFISKQTDLCQATIFRRINVVSCNRWSLYRFVCEVKSAPKRLIMGQSQESN